MRWGNFTAIETIVINAAIWGTIQAGIGIALARIPYERFRPDRGIFRIRPWESDQLYEHYFLVRKWKLRLPDAARLSRRGFRKRKLVSRSREYLVQFRQETVRAEATHWLAIPPCALFFVWDIPSVAVWMPVYALVVNMPCIVVQRYNRIRISRVLRNRDRRQHHTGSALRPA